MRVCKEIYLSKPGISSRIIQWYYDHKIPVFEAKRRQYIKSKLPEATLCIIRDHINPFPRAKFPYCRDNLSR